jgi:predicted Zn-dependent peptidase
MRLPAPLAAALACATLAASPAARAADDIAIPFTKTTLPNGMTVIFSEDHSLPKVVVNIVYKVGSRFEEPHRSGFAHLFEHLMFMGSRRAPTGEFDRSMEAAGGMNNANTTTDRTDFYDIAPAGSLPLLLWLEADRLRDLGPLMTKEKLDLQRDVVRNERRQSIENQPYGIARLRLPALLYPEGHPYHHSVIGSHEDLEAAKVDDVKAFFAKYYDPANASLVVAGDFKPEEATQLLQRWFATIPSNGKPADPGEGPIDPGATALKSVVRETVQDRVELARTYMAWQSPKHLAKGDAELDLLASILTKGKASRLYQALVYEKKLAQSVSASQQSAFLGSTFELRATARPGVSLDALESAIDAELAKLRTKPIAADELARAKNGYEAQFVEQLEGVDQRAAMLNEYQLETGDPGYVQRDLDRYRKATTDDVQAVAQKVLDPNARVILRIVPKGDAK